MINRKRLKLLNKYLSDFFQFPPGQDKPDLVLGRAFEPGNDINHFCMPTAVAVSETTGDFYVADGYCNARIMKYSKDGKLKRIISKILLTAVLCFVVRTC